MESFGVSLIPLASFWALFNSLLKAAEFVNSIRDCVISGKKNNGILSENARRAMLSDWKLTMIGVVSSCIGFAAILLCMGLYLYFSDWDYKSVGMVLALISIAPCFGSILFTLCGMSDLRAMKQEIENISK